MLPEGDPTSLARRRQSVFDLTATSLREHFAAMGEPSFRATQVLEWTYTRRVTSFAGMTNLPQTLRAQLSQALSIFESDIVTEVAASDGTVKRLLRWEDGATSECVLIPDGTRRTACISTQVGCPVRCSFCASGLDGLERHLTAGQIVEQAMRVQELCDEERLSNIVFMGLGEPLANYAATVQAIRTINAEWGMGIGARKITISTVGLPGPMRRLADEGLQVTLALSLHAPTDELRRELIPWAERVSIDELVRAAQYYFERLGREITLEYILLGGVNDQVEHARALVDVARHMRSNVNLIPYNPVSGLPYQRPREEAQDRFLSTLRSAGVNTHLRRSRGLDIDAACGQLRRRESARYVRLGAVATDPELAPKVDPQLPQQRRD